MSPPLPPNRPSATYQTGPVMIVGLDDRIYEAALVPELWPDVLDRIGAVSGSASGSILAFSAPDSPPRYKTTSLTEASLHAFTTSDQWRDSQRAQFLFTDGVPDVFSQFVYMSDFMTAEQLAADTVEANLRDLGLGQQITTVIPMPSREVVSFTWERRLGEGRHDPASIGLLDSLRPHLARAGLISARLNLERARATVSALDAIGLPAAVLTRAGIVLAANALLEALGVVFRPSAFGGLSISDEKADALLRKALAALAVNHSSGSIPIKSSEGRAPMVVHLLPVKGMAHDLFAGGNVLLVVTALTVQGGAPAPHVLHGLFDLTPSESRLAAVLSRGLSIAEAADRMGTTVKTARTYLERIFVKTGTNRQSQLMALLQGVGHPFPGLHRESQEGKV
ncbi:helix-turn-helix transcriptional regulator [Corticibacterium sp. UT-5YL-CI-8]|nr:helix-turn-helix transcriptional regulator [Tianweitania sp. UT-5YL-CI-8]